MVNEDPFRLDGKTFLITGGTRGIGRAISLRFAEAGASVIAVYVRNEESAESLAGVALEGGLGIDCLRADLSRPSALETIEKHLEEAEVKLAGLVHCAATGVHKKADEYTSRDIKWVFSLNLDAFVVLVKQLLPWMDEEASIVALSSKGATRAVPSYGLVGASKGALEAYCRQLASELAGRGIRVNVLTPGTILTDVWDVMPDRDRRLADTIQRTPIGRLVTAEEVASTAQFLCSNAGSGVVGHTLVVDGGSAILE